MPKEKRIVCLSNALDQPYYKVRGEKAENSVLTASFRRDLFLCMKMASGREVIVLSSPPKATERRGPKWLPAVETKFFSFRQFVCSNWDAPKLRIPVSWFFYARHVLHHVRSGDVVVIDNYEFIYVLAARLARLFRDVTFVLVYLDGKHLVDRGLWRVLSGLAEWAGRPLFRAALLSNPWLGRRLPECLPKELVPGFVPDELPPAPSPPAGKVRFLYSGGMDRARGADLLLAALEQLPETGWHLDITGFGEFGDRAASLAQDARWRDRVKYHHTLPSEAYATVLKAAHVGLNCQRASDPISGGTLPSKVFNYLSAGLLVISSNASAVKELCGNACLYYDQETPQSLAGAMKEVIANYSGVRQELDPALVFNQYSIKATVGRVRWLFRELGVVPEQ